MKILAEGGVPASYVFDTLDLFSDQHLTSRDFITEVQHPVNGTIKLMRHPLRMSGALLPGRSPLLGEHTADVLQEYLDVTPEAFQDLVADGITIAFEQNF